MAVNYIPQGYHTATPYLIVKGAARAIDFYKQAFGATELMRFAGPGGSIGHAEIRIGDSPIMLADEMPSVPLWYPENEVVHTPRLQDVVSQGDGNFDFVR